MPHNTLKPRLPRARSSTPMSASLPPSRPSRLSQASQSTSRGVKRPLSPFRDTPSRKLASRPQIVSENISSRLQTPLAPSSPGSGFNRVNTLQSVDRRHTSTPRTERVYSPDKPLSELDETNTAQEEQDEEEDTDVIMAVDYRGKRLGCSFYTEANGILWFVNDIEINLMGATAAAGRDLFEAIKFQIQPTVTLFPGRADELFLSEDTESLSSTSALNIRPAPEFSVEQGKSKLAELTFDADDFPVSSFITPDSADITEDINNELGDGYNAPVGKKQKMLRLESYIDIEWNWVSVGCAGALLTHIRRKRTIQNPYNEEGSSRSGVQKIKLWTMENTMFINADTMTSLQIFKDESHPSFIRQGEHGRGTEGLSLFGIINSTCTPQGYQCLKQMFLRPSLDASIITSRYNAIQVLIRPDNSNAFGGILKNLKKVPDIAKILAVLRKGGANSSAGEIGVSGIDKPKAKRSVSSGTWGAIRNFAYNAIQIKNTIAEMIGIQNVDIFRKITDIFETVLLQNVGRLIEDTIDFEESKYEGRVCVKSGISMVLDNLKHTYNGLEALLDQVAQDIIKDLPNDVRESGISINVVYFPQLGYLIRVPKDDEGEALYSGPEFECDEDEDDEKWSWMFGTDESSYFKNYKMQGLDIEVGDIFGLMCDSEIELLHELQEKVMRYEEILLTCSRICGELDSIIAMAQATLKYRLVRPVITEENTIEIRGGRHILQELCVSSFIPNDTQLSGRTGEDTQELVIIDSESSSFERDNQKSMMIVTGPNYSGKSVYLKQVALMVYMAHIGCFVPAESATIGLTDAILTRIQTRESVSKTQSAFMIDLQQIASALRLASRRTLLIIDEFGKGTESTDGAGLACAVAEYLLSLGGEAPKTLMATHYHEIFEHGFLNSHPLLSFGHMKILLDQTAENAENQITYLYTLDTGRSTSSFGTVCAAMNGIEKPIVDRAEDLIVKMAKGEDVANICAAMTPREVRELAYSEHIARRFMQLDLEDFMVTGEQENLSISVEPTKAALEKIFNGRLA